MKKLAYSELLSEHKNLQKSFDKSNTYNIGVISNTIVNQFKEIIEYNLLINNIYSKVTLGDYDNIVQDSIKFKEYDLVVIFWDICNIIDGFQYEIELYDNKTIDEVINKIKNEINLVFKNLSKSSLVIFNSFSDLSFSSLDIQKNKLNYLKDNLNTFLENNLPENFKLINIEKIFCKIGLDNSFDYRFFYSSKSLYSIEFYKSYTLHISPLILAVKGKSKKALIFDCDNTLWKGILGEDGFNGIEMSKHSKNGKIFHEIQKIAITLNKKGILLGLCSKNNQSDVDEVIKNHPGMLLNDDVLTIKKVNWIDKASNLLEISKELNIGLDSIVFIDDSSFEINLIKEQLPDIITIQVPVKLYNYPKLLRENVSLFHNLSYSNEDLQKSKMYKEQVIRNSEKNNFNSIEDYLSSLQLKIKVYDNEKSIIPRMSQMTQKTNQFNLTTKRYTEKDIENFIDDSSFNILSWSVDDKFGENGITGLCIINLLLDKKIAIIDTYLMSCRIIGRNIEFSIMDYIIDSLKKIGINKVSASFIETAKNSQVKDFYKKNSFIQSTKTKNQINFELLIDNYTYHYINYIKIENGK
jgi:FkbH-like protein